MKKKSKKKKKKATFPEKEPNSLPHSTSRSTKPLSPEHGRSWLLNFIPTAKKTQQPLIKFEMVWDCLKHTAAQIIIAMMTVYCQVILALQPPVVKRKGNVCSFCNECTHRISLHRIPTSAQALLCSVAGEGALSGT